jgi:hypothetical protein
MTDDELIAALRARVEAGDYLDKLEGTPGVDVQGGGAFRQHGDLLARLYCRGTPEYARAEAAGWLQRLPRLARANEAEVRRAERALDQSLPPLLRRSYLDVANGGFGPGYGLLGVRGGHRHERGAGIERYESDKCATLVSLLHWGCGIHSLVDCATPDARMWASDPNAPDDKDDPVFPQPYTLATWLARWLDGTLPQPFGVLDEATGRHRDATAAEHRAALADE